MMQGSLHSDDEELDRLYTGTLDAWDADRNAEVVDGATTVISRYPDSPEAHALRFLLALGYEFGNFGHYDLERALRLYREMLDGERWVSDEMLIGEARVLFRTDPRRHRDRIEARCHQAIEAHDNIHAHMILGRLREAVDGDFLAARKLYWAAYRKGLPWGLRMLSAAYGRRGNWFVATILSFCTAVTSPFMVARNGLRGPYSKQTWVYDLLPPGDQAARP